MPIEDHASPWGVVHADASPDLKEIVLGLHWSPPGKGVAEAADLDALCALLDAQGHVLEVVYPGHPRNAGDSVIHTGDSRAGTNLWDDERILVFLDALPQTVARVALLVVSATGHAFDAVRGAFCHVSDRVSENEWVRIDLTALAGRTSCVVATLSRGPAGWLIAADALPVEDGLLARVRALTESAKRAERAQRPGGGGRLRP